MARAADAQDGYSDFGGGTSKAWLRVKAPFAPALRDGTGLVDKPGGLVLEAVGAGGAITTYWLWIDRNGLVHLKTSEPTDEDETTSIAAPKNIRISTIGIDPGVIIAGSTLEVATTITGVAVGDLIVLEAPAWASGDSSAYAVNLVARVSAADTIRVKFTNLSGNSLDIHEGGATYRYFWFDLT